MPDVLHALQTIDPKKAAGPDDLGPFLLKREAEVIAKPVTYIFNLPVYTNKVPVSWKQAYVTPLLIAGDSCKMNNYTPISNLSALAKVLEYLVSDQFKMFLDSHNILNGMQSGFRSRNSTVTATLKVIDDLKAAIDKKSFCGHVYRPY